MFGFDDLFGAAEQRLKRIKELLEKMAYDFTKLDAALTAIVAKVDALTATGVATDPAVQAHIDSVAAALEA